MAEQERAQPQVDEKPGTGIDRTVIRELLALTAAERVRLVDNDARVLAQLDRAGAKLRRR